MTDEGLMAVEERQLEWLPNGRHGRRAPLDDTTVEDAQADVLDIDAHISSP